VPRYDVSNVKGFGPHKGYGEAPQGTDNPEQLFSKLKLKVVVLMELVGACDRQDHLSGPHRQHQGAARSLVTSVQKVVRIRTDGRG
jgi:nitrogen regulatory protein PII